MYAKMHNMHVHIYKCIYWDLFTPGNGFVSAVRACVPVRGLVALVILGEIDVPCLSLFPLAALILPFSPVRSHVPSSLR